MNNVAMKLFLEPLKLGALRMTGDVEFRGMSSSRRNFVKEAPDHAIEAYLWQRNVRHSRENDPKHEYTESRERNRQSTETER